MGEQAKTLEYRFGTARPHEARSMTRRGNEARQTTMRLRRAMKNLIPATILCIQNRCHSKNPRCHKASGIFCFQSAILIDAKCQKRRADGI